MPIQLERGCALVTARRFARSCPLLERDFTVVDGRYQMVSFVCGDPECRTVVGVFATVRTGWVTLVQREIISGECKLRKE